MKRNLLLITMLSGLFLSLKAQSNLFIDQSYTVEEMVMDFFDCPEITISNVTSSANSSSIAFFDAGGTDLGVDAGIVFCTGDVQDVVGPNSSPGVSTALGLPGDADIDLLDGIPSNDAVLIEFDFTVSVSDTLDFNYVFGSEEYLEWVNTIFNDAFAFFISGPGISGPYSNGAENFALIPNTNEGVAINTVNDVENSQYYVNNDNGIDMEYDGLTTPLPASFIAVSGETYHVKIVVADRGDSILDSGIFLSFNSLAQDSLLVPPTSFQPVQNSNTVTFVNESKYATSWEWNFGNGEMSSERFPAPVTYTSVGTYTVTLTTQNYCCSETYTMQVDISEVAIAATVNTTNNPLACYGGNAGIDLQVAGGIPPYTIAWSPAIPDFDNVSAGTYTYTITDNDGNVFSDDVFIESPDAISIDVATTDEFDQQGNGSADATALGGTGDFTYLWSNNETTPFIDNLIAGTYTVVVTDENGCTESMDVVINSSFTPISITTTTTNNPLACFGDQNATAAFEFSGGVPPFTTMWSPANADFDNLAAGLYGVTITDSQGATTSTEIIITEPDEIVIDITTVDAGTTLGSATANVTGGTSPFEYEWSNGGTTQMIDELTGDDYTVTVTDANGCTLESTATVMFVLGITAHNDFSFQLFPNPVKDQLFLEWSEATAIKELLVFDMLGQTVPVSFDLSGNKVAVQFDRVLASGVYHLQVALEDGRRGVERFVSE